MKIIVAAVTYDERQGTIIRTDLYEGDEHKIWVRIADEHSFPVNGNTEQIKEAVRLNNGDCCDYIVAYEVENCSKHEVPAFLKNKHRQAIICAGSDKAVMGNIEEVYDITRLSGHACVVPVE